MSRDGGIVSIAGGIKKEKMGMRRSRREETAPGIRIGSATAPIGTRLAIGMPMKMKMSTDLLSRGRSSTLVMGVAITGHIAIGVIGIGIGREIDLVRGIRRVCMSDVKAFIGMSGNEVMMIFSNVFLIFFSGGWRIFGLIWENTKSLFGFI